jgi:hypothetical protein
MPRRWPENLALCFAAGALAAGCAAPASGPSGQGQGVARAVNQGQAWEVVLPSAQTALAQAEGPEYTRRDLLLADAEASDLPPDAWPVPLQPSLDQTRRLFINTSRNEVLYISNWATPRFPWRLWRPWVPWW